MGTTPSSGAETVDVVVVGAGAAGLMAAIEAADLGASVVVLQKLPEPGGKSALAIGSISAAGTALQRERGIADSTAQHRADLDRRIANGTITPLSMDKLYTVVDHGAAAVERLVELGITFSGPHPEFRDEIRRMHVVQPTTRAMVATLAQAARARGVRIRSDSPVDAFALDEDGRVVGVQGPQGRIDARAAVVIASGDFSAPSRLGLAAPTGAENAFRSWASGDGHFLAQSAGAALVNTEAPLRPQLRTVDWPHIEPHAGLFRAGAILVDRAGSRVVDELDQPALALAAADPQDVFVIMDSTVLERIATASDDSPVARDGWLGEGKLYISTFPGVGYSYAEDVVAAGYGFVCRSLSELGSKLGISALDADDTLCNAPYFGFGPLRAWAILGRSGVRINAELQPLAADGTPVPGLLVAGAAAGSTGFAYGHGYELAWAVVSGRLAGQLAGRQAARQAVDA